MKVSQFFLYLIILFSSNVFAQDFGDFPKIEKDKLLRDVELIYQGLDQYHTGMYWYTPKDSVDMIFEQVKKQIDRDLNILEFHKIITPFISLCREDHTDIYLPEDIDENIKEQANLLPLKIVFLGNKLFCVKNGSSDNTTIEGKEILSINGETPIEITNKIGNLFASDGYIKTVKYSDLEGFSFAKYYYYYYGNLSSFQVQFKGIEKPVVLKPIVRKEIDKNLENRYKSLDNKETEKEFLEFKILNDKTAYVGIHSFSNYRIKKCKTNNNFKDFLEKSFQTIADKNIETLIIDVSQNGGGNEGNEGILYSYIGNNYQKYKKVRAKTQKTILDNGIDKPIKLKTFGPLERTLVNKKMNDGSYERKTNVGFGLMAFKKEPKTKYKGKIYVIIGPITYSGGSEFANMVYTNKLATFVGQETGGGYYGNTSGYSRELTLPHSKITIDLPALQFMMNVEKTIPFGRGVLPHHEVVPTFEQYQNKENAPLQYILKQQ